MVARAADVVRCFFLELIIGQYLLCLIAEAVELR
jgi:hypothetical protein